MADIDHGSYAGVLQRQIELLQQAKSKKGQKPSQNMKRSRVQLEQEFFTSVRLAMNDSEDSPRLTGRQALRAQFQQMQMTKNQSEHMMKTTFLGEAYPPSTKALSALTPIGFRDMRLETHHRGRVLIAKTFCDPIQMSSVQNAIEDPSGDVERLALYNLSTPSSTRDFQKILPKNAVVAVKEPYYKCSADGGVLVRVDHPSDFVLLKPSDPLVPIQWRQEDKAAPSAAQLKAEGNAAFKTSNWDDAVRLYSEALSVVGDDHDLRHTLFRNRCQARLHLGQFELAVDDATSSIIPGDDLPERARKLNSKALVRAGRAHYSLGEFAAAREQFQRAADLGVEDGSTPGELERAGRRLAEQDEGDYDFAAMAASATEAHTSLDHASFLRNTTVAPAGRRGRGLFAAEDIPHGGIVLVEKAFCAAFRSRGPRDTSLLIDLNTKYMAFGAHAECLSNTIAKMRSGAGRADKYLDLYGGPGYQTGAGAPVVDGAVAVDTFQVQAIAQFNGFGCPDIKSSRRSGDGDGAKQWDGSTGVWLRASYANHACIGNAGRAFMGDMMIVRATKDIRAGDEILMGYVPPDALAAERTSQLSFYGFDCDCASCGAERQVPAAVLARREALAKAADEFVRANRPSASRPVPRARLQQANDLRAGLEATYSKSLYEGLPRFGCVAIDLWLCQVVDSPVDGIVSATRLLQDLGYKITVKGSDLTIDRTNGVAILPTLHGAMYAAQAWEAADRGKVATGFVEFGKELYLTLFGEMDGFEEKFGNDLPARQ